MVANPSDIPRVADEVDEVCRARGADQGTYERMLKYAGDGLSEGKSIDLVMGMIREALRCAGYPEGEDELPPLVG